jgi:glycosyltransferase involved in cell wall biosynthesis
MLGLLLSDPRLRAASGISGQQRARKHYLWETRVKEIDAVYVGLIGPSIKEKTQLATG